MQVALGWAWQNEISAKLPNQLNYLGKVRNQIFILNAHAKPLQNDGKF